MYYINFLARVHSIKNYKQKVDLRSFLLFWVKSNKYNKKIVAINNESVYNILYIHICFYNLTRNRNKLLLKGE